MDDSGTALSARFLRHLPADAPPLDLRQASCLASFVASVQQAWPRLQLDLDGFLGHVAHRLAPGEELTHALSGLCGADLYLAYGCSLQDAGALRILEQNYLARLGSVLRSFNPSASFADEVRQLLREKLLMPREGRPPRILDYAGRGPLQTWLKSAAVRLAINLQESARTTVALGADDDALDKLSTEAGEPDLSLLRQRFGTAFSAAFQKAMRALTAEQRNLLRLHLLDGLSIDKLAPVFNTHRSTVARWLVRDRELLVEHTKRELSKTLRVERDELDELMGLVRSQLDISIRRFLQTTKG